MRDAMKRTGHTVHTIAEFVKYATRKEAGLNCNPSTENEETSFQIVRLWNGRERLLWQIEKRKSIFHLPAPHDAPPPAPDDARAHLLARRRYLADDEAGVEGTNHIGTFPGKRGFGKANGTTKKRRTARKGTK